MNTPEKDEAETLEAEKPEVDELEPKAEAEEAEADADASLLMRDTEVALTLKVSQRHVHNLVGMGLLDKVKLGPKTARITRSSVLKLAARRATDNTPTAA